MLFVLYNLIQAVVIVLFWPAFLALILLKPKYRNRIPVRLGLGLSQTLPRTDPQTMVFWVHALSVGEVTSAVPLVTGLRTAYPESRIIVSVTTQSGQEVAQSFLEQIADQIISSPIDLLPVLSRFIDRIKPNAFILIETDFWPNLLLMLKQRNIPAVLVNGRISKKSLKDYRKFSFFFQPIFSSFSAMAMQTKADAMHMVEFGIASQKIHTLGNLKFDTIEQVHNVPQSSVALLIPQGRPIFTAGSTHQGEEDSVFQAFKGIRETHPNLFLVLAPRDPKRARELLDLGTQYGLKGALRSRGEGPTADFLLVDTIGELVTCYSCSNFAFVGGSLVPQGGHNPIEPANFAVPVLFGPHMEDFAEISAELLDTGGALTVRNSHELQGTLMNLIKDEQKAITMGKAAWACINSRKGVIDAHLRLIATVL